MSTMLTGLLSLLRLQALDDNRFRGASIDLGFRQLFGGQALGQALSAATQTVEEDRIAHSLHGYFLRPGDPKQPVFYQVERVRDGGTFSTRRVVATQQENVPIFFASVSFQKPESGYSHQLPMPDVPAPEEVPTQLEYLKETAGDKLPKGLLAHLALNPPVDVRQVPQKNDAPRQYFWMRANGSMPDTPSVHQRLLAWMSDFNLLATSLLPHGITLWDKSLQITSLDHALWFHQPLRLDDWLLYAMDSPWAGSGRGFARGQLFNRTGELVAEVAQEGLIRQRQDWA